MKSPHSTTPLNHFFKPGKTPSSPNRSLITLPLGSRRAICAPILFLVLFCQTVFGIAPGPGKITLVDGTRTEGEILFEHPNAKLLVLRSLANRTVQTLPLSIIQQVVVGNNTVKYSAARALTEAEKKELEENRIWGDEVGPGQLGRYGKQAWAKKPLLVWANPGESGSAFELENWLDESGKPLKAEPWKAHGPGGAVSKDENEKDASSTYLDGDVLLPGADSQYSAFFKPKSAEVSDRMSFRHVTVERKASFNVPNSYAIVGNLWVKSGGMVETGAARLGGCSNWGIAPPNEAVNTFARFSNDDLSDPDNCVKDWYNPVTGVNTGVTSETWWAYVYPIGHYVWIDAGEGSVEIIGQSGGADDRLDVARGTMIVAEDSFIGNGERAAFFSHKDTTTILLNGARLGKGSPFQGGDGGHVMGTYGIAGTLMFGAPDHPLTRDLIFDAAYYPASERNTQVQPSQRTHGASFVLGTTGSMIVHSKDPTKARVVFCPRSRMLPLSNYTLPKGSISRINDKPLFVEEKRHYYPAKPEIWDHIVGPLGVSAVFHGKTDFNGVVFDGFLKGGIVVSDGDRARWKNVSYGKDNLGSPSELYRSFETP